MVLRGRGHCESKVDVMEAFGNLSTEQLQVLLTPARSLSVEAAVAWSLALLYAALR